MTGAIKDLWHGNLCPQDKPLPHQLMELFNLTSSYRQKLFDQLPEEQQHLFDSFLDAYGSLHQDLEQEAFINGFRTATKLIMDGIIEPQV